MLAEAFRAARRPFVVFMQSFFDAWIQQSAERGDQRDERIARATQLPIDVHEQWCAEATSFDVEPSLRRIRRRSSQGLGHQKLSGLARVVRQLLVRPRGERGGGKEEEGEERERKPSAIAAPPLA